MHTEVSEPRTVTGASTQAGSESTGSLLEADVAAVTAATPVTERAPAAGGEHAVANHRFSLASAYAEEAAAEQAMESTLGSLSPETILKVWEMEQGGRHQCARQAILPIACHT